MDRVWEGRCDGRAGETAGTRGGYTPGAGVVEYHNGTESMVEQGGRRRISAGGQVAGGDPRADRTVQADLLGAPGGGRDSSRRRDGGTLRRRGGTGGG